MRCRAWAVWRAGSWGFASGIVLEIFIMTADAGRATRGLIAMATILGLAELVRWLGRHLRWVRAEA